MGEMSKFQRIESQMMAQNVKMEQLSHTLDKITHTLHVLEENICAGGSNAGEQSNPYARRR